MKTLSPLWPILLAVPLLRGATVASLATDNSSAPETIVLPGEQYRNANGDSATIPLSAESREFSIYPQSEFSSSLPQGGLITSIAFRLDEGVTPGLHAYSSDVEIRMSTSASLTPTVPFPSLIFNRNVGPDETIVFPRQTIEFQVNAVRSGVNGFDLVVKFSKPFFYDPLKGSLAIDISCYGGSTIGPNVDATLGDPSLHDITLFGNVKAETALGPSVTPINALGIIPLPEPATASLLVIGATALFLGKGGRLVEGATASAAAHQTAGRPRTFHIRTKRAALLVAAGPPPPTL